MRESARHNPGLGIMRRFQYSMEAFGAKPLDFEKSDLRADKILVIPENNTNTEDFTTVRLINCRFLETS
jgi:hypothetical protein